VKEDNSNRNLAKKTALIVLMDILRLERHHHLASSAKRVRPLLPIQVNHFRTPDASVSIEFRFCVHVGILLLSLLMYAHTPVHSFLHEARAGISKYLEWVMLNCPVRRLHLHSYLFNLCSVYLAWQIQIYL
jgi:hypothetical protein